MPRGNLIHRGFIAAGILLAVSCTILGQDSSATKPSFAAPLLAQLNRFSAADVPAVGNSGGFSAAWAVWVNATADRIIPGRGRTWVFAIVWLGDNRVAESLGTVPMLPPLAPGRRSHYDMFRPMREPCELFWLAHGGSVPG